jgi:hypothetical protein
MTTTFNKNNKTNATLNLENKYSGLTWDEADYTWDEANSPWDAPKQDFNKSDKTNATLNLVSKT